jgi:membrane-bound lytic murein transglycosylase F
MIFSAKYNNLWIKFFLLLIAAALVLWLITWSKNKRETQQAAEFAKKDLDRIIESGVLKAVVDYNSTNYFIYRGRPMGFQFELLQNLCTHMGVKLDIKVSNNLVETFEGLKNGTYDVVAKNLTITSPRRTEFDFTVPLLKTRQVLVQRVKSKNDNDSVYINGTSKLAGKKVYIQKNTSFYRRLKRISEEIGKEIEIIEDTVYGVEQLVTRVAQGDIDYTVCDENVAILNKTYYPNLDVSLRLSFPQNIAWAVRQGSSDWKSYLNDWIIEFKGTRKYRQIYHKYFESSRIAQRTGSDLHSINGGKISNYDDIIRKMAEQYNWDWRLIASMIYNESRFNAEADSWNGAYGLMQLLPTTAEAFGIGNYQDPQQNIRAGILFLNWIDNQFIESIPDSTERIKFDLAAYNIGLGHVKDAQRLAEKYGKNNKVWENNVDYFLESKSMKKYYTDSVVYYGYCRGKEAVDYVQRVKNNYNHYLNLIAK